MVTFDNGRRIERITYKYADGSTRQEERINGVPTHLIEEDQSNDDLLFTINDRNGRSRGMTSLFHNLVFGGRGSTDFERFITQLMGQMRIDRNEHPALS